MSESVVTITPTPSNNPSDCSSSALLCWVQQGIGVSSTAVMVGITVGALLLLIIINVVCRCVIHAVKQRMDRKKRERMKKEGVKPVKM